MGGEIENNRNFDYGSQWKTSGNFNFSQAATSKMQLDAILILLKRGKREVTPVGVNPSPGVSAINFRKSQKNPKNH